MLPLIAPPPRPRSAAGLQWSEASVAHALEDDCFRLDDGRQARQAASCLLRPAPGDTVVVAHGTTGTFISAVLVRSAPAAQLGVPGARTLSLHQPRIELCAGEALGLHCGGDVELNSLHGSVLINAQHLLTSVAQSLVQTSRHWITRVEHAVLEASALLRLHGQQGLITAKADLKVDAERISLG